MFTKKISGLFLLLLLIAQTSTAQTSSDSLQFRKWRLTLINPISTNGNQASAYTAKYSINIIGGVHGGLGPNGREIGGIFNINKQYASGAMIAGGFNYTGGYMEGLNIAGGINYSGGYIEGLSIAGIANIARKDLTGLSAAGIGNFALDDLEGLQASGVLNVAKGSISGLQAAGFANIAGGYVEGLQAAGVFNYAGKGLSGLQASATANITMGDMEGLFATGGINYSSGNMSGLMGAGVMNMASDIEGLTFAGITNISKTFSGMQIAPFNAVSGTAEGMQIGILNIAKEFDGASIGVLSLYGNGRYNIDARYSDGGFTDISLTTGTHRVYNMAMFGYNTALDRDVYRIGFAVGLEKNVKDSFENWESETFFINQEFSVHHHFENEWDKKLNLIYSYKFLVGKRFGSGLSLYGGPSVNMQVTRVNEASDYSWYSVWSPSGKGRDYQFWVGFTTGIRLFKQKHPPLLKKEWNNYRIEKTNSN